MIVVMISGKITENNADEETSLARLLIPNTREIKVEGHKIFNHRQSKLAPKLAQLFFRKPVII